MYHGLNHRFYVGIIYFSDSPFLFTEFKVIFTDIFKSCGSPLPTLTRRPLPRLRSRTAARPAAPELYLLEVPVEGAKAAEHIIVALAPNNK